MLKALRSKKTAKKIWLALAVIIVPAFSLWGIGAAVRGRQKPPFLGRVSGKTVSLQQFLKNYKALRDQYLIQLGQEQLARLEKFLNLEAQAWDRIVLLAEAKRQGIRVSNQGVVDFIKQYPFFKSKGRFDPALYQELLTYVFRSSPRDFEEEIRDNLVIAKLYAKVTEGITLSDEEIKSEYNKANEQISLDYISAQRQDFLEEVGIEEEELLEYYNKNSQEFKKPLSYNLEYIKLGNENKQAINKITQSIEQGFSLADAARQAKLELKESGLFNINEPIPHIGWSTEISRLLPELEPGAKAWPQPIQVDADSAYFIGLKEKRQPHIPAFDEVRDKVDEKLRRQKASQLAREKLNACREKIETAGFSESAEEFNLSVGETELFKRRSYVKGLGDSDMFFAAIENLGEGRVSEILATPSGFCLVKLKQRLMPGEEEFGQEKQDFADKLLEEKKQEHFQQFLSQLKNKPNTFITTANLPRRNP